MLLRTRGRLGLIVPSSMSVLAGYAPTRAAHDRRAACDPALRDFGTEEFRGVFQPCMALHSTRRLRESEADGRSAWPVERTDLDASMRSIVERLSSLAALPSELFGERGLQTSGDDVANLARVPDAARNVGLRTGSDISPFRREPPSLYAKPGDFGARLRRRPEWARVRILIRQTARVPIASLSDGCAFRNSILAGFATPAFPPAFLVAYLNSTPVRWLHYVRHRDARQGLPQVKIGHLRSIPRSPSRGHGLEARAHRGKAVARQRRNRRTRSAGTRCACSEGARTRRVRDRNNGGMGTALSVTRASARCSDSRSEASCASVAPCVSDDVRG